MSKLIASLFFACMLAAVPGQAQELTKQAKIERILDLTNSQASVDKLLDQMTSMINSQMKTQMPKATPEQLAQAQEMQSKMMELIKSRMSWTKMRDSYVKVYADLYSDSEIDGMLAFYESPAGRGYLEKMPLMTQRIMMASQTQMGDLMPEILRIIQESAQKKQ
jgi:hypothetical protein